MTPPVLSPEASGFGYNGPFGILPVPYSRGIFNFHWFNLYNAVCFQIVTGPPTVLLAKELGANSLTLGVIASFMPLMTVLQLPAAHRLGNRGYRSFALLGWGLRSLFIAVVAAVPLLGCCSQETRLGLLIGGLFLFNLLRGIASAAFLPWITGIVPAGIRGRFLALDHTFINGGFLLAMLFSALLMGGESQPWRYSLVLLLALAFAVISLLCLRRVPDVACAAGTGLSSAPVALRVMAAFTPFRSYILFNLVFVTVTGGLGVFPVEYLRVQAGFSPALIYALSAGIFLGPMLVLRRFGARVDRVGSIPVIRASLLVFAFVLAVWFALSAGILAPGWKIVLLLNVVGGTALALFNLANGHLVMAMVPDRGKNHYFAVATVIGSLGAALSPVAWGWILDALGTLDIAEGPFHLRRHSVYFLGICLLSLLALATSRILREAGGGRSSR